MRTGSKMEWVSPDPLILLQAGQASVARQPLNADEERQGQAPSAEWTFDQAAFDELLGWLDPDPEAAGQVYELIRRKLIAIFRCRRCAFPEDLADETINRVARKLPQIKPDYSGSPALYFYGVAKKVYKEYLRSLSLHHAPPIPTVKEDREELLQHLDDALSKLAQADRQLILDYYRGEGRSKIAHRKDVAKQMGLGPNALRLRVHRIRTQLRKHLFERCELAFS